MQRSPLGSTGIEVSRIALGCGNFGGIGSAPAFFGQGETRGQAFELMDAARGLGVTLFDTADAYGGGRSERWIGEWLQSRPAGDVAVCTKVFHSVSGDARDTGLGRERIRRQIEGSLARLRLARVHLYLLHEHDPETPLEETLTVLDELVREGRVGAIGASNVDTAWLERARSIAGERGLERIAVVQNSYSLLDRGAERDVLPYCARNGIAFTAFSPLAGGWLAGRYRRGEPAPPGSRMSTRPEPYAHLVGDRVFDKLDALDEAARSFGVDRATLALAWLLADARIASVVVGPRRPEHLQPARAALELELSDADRARLAGL